MRLLSSISVFFPCYNDAQTIRGLVMTADETLRALTNDYEIIVVDDGSTDDSLDILRQMEAEFLYFRLVQHPVNRGYGAAIASGFRAATRDFVFYTDGDGQYDPRELALLVAEMKPGVDVVNGYKRTRQDPWYRVLTGSFYQRTARVLFSLPIRDVDCDFRLLRREALRDIELESNDGAICVELVRKLRDSGRTMVEVPVTHFVRAFGTSQFFKPRRIARAAIGVGRWYWHLVVLGEQKRRTRALTEGATVAEASAETLDR